MFRSLPTLLAAPLAAAPATAQVRIGPTVSADGPTAAIGVPQENIGDRLPRWLGDGRFRLLPD